MSAVAAQQKSSADIINLQLFIPLFDSLAEAVREADEDEEMLPINQIALLLVDWTDPSKIVYV